MGRYSKQTKMQVRFFRILLASGFTDVTQQLYADYRYSEMELADYAQLMKRAFKKGNYLINCDYGCAGIKVGNSCGKMGFEYISDKLIALVIYLAGLKNNNSRYKFGYYVTSVKNLNDVYDAIMVSYPYPNPPTACKMSIAEARTQLLKILEKIKCI